MASESPDSCRSQTLQEWRNCKGQPRDAYPRNMWTSLEPFFLSQGYTLWTPPDGLNLWPPNDAPRTPDGYVHNTKYNDGGWEPTYDLINSIHCPARTTDNRDVMIRLMAIGTNRGENHREALKRLAPDHNTSHDCYIVPMLTEIVYNDMIFAVFPMMSKGFSNPWYYQLSEVFDAVGQVLEAINFCHERLVAHRDLDDDNILINWIGGRYRLPDAMAKKRIDPFRSLFPIRYYLNDFEFAVTFDPGSEPSSRLVTGIPSDGIRTGEYERDPVPEMLSEAPYCPFRADIWQLGNLFMSCFGHLGYLSQPLVTLFNEMCSEDPNSRPSASEALERVRQLASSCQTRSASVPLYELRSWTVTIPRH